jgi:hypothetical protein
MLRLPKHLKPDTLIGCRLGWAILKIAGLQLLAKEQQPTMTDMLRLLSGRGGHHR